jgi:ribosomal protein S17E
MDYPFFSLGIDTTPQICIVLTGFGNPFWEVIHMTEYDTLKRLVDEAAEDVSKAIGGNKAAGTRVRKKMQEIKAAAQDVRKKILEGRETPEAGQPE